MTKLNDKNFYPETAKSLARAYILSSDEPLLVMEARDHLIAQARQQGFAERALYSVDPGMKWEDILDRCQSMSLFSGRCIVDIRFHDFKINSAGASGLTQLAHALNDDTLVIISTPRPGTKERRTAWYKALSSVAECITFWPPHKQEFEAWLEQRCRRLEIKADKAALSCLAERLEGNLLAAHQEITKLAALYPTTLITRDKVEDSVQNHARFNVFEIQQAIVGGNLTAILHLLTMLEDSGEETVLVLWAITQFIRQMKKACTELSNGVSAREAIQKAGLKGSLPFQKSCEKAVIRLSVTDLDKLLIQAADADKTIKTYNKEATWPRLQQMCLRLGRLCVSSRPRSTLAAH